ncbi:unnamed protein product [Dibothriocephalus latus]|uniref:Uncharacterized protein n=1 Tax=Dibothriocephalus latus TaxID=60516 RepID=A0A3P7LYI7_DIBLA|nr:unnamed protein product [Dibothriocephalus latus]
MREARDALAAVALSDGRVFVFGGWNGHSSLASVEFCQLRGDWSHTIATAARPEEGFWRPLEPMRTPRYFHAAVAFRGKIIVAGGYASAKDDQDDVGQAVVEVFSPPTAERPLGEWTRVADLLVPRKVFTLLVYKDRLYALGNNGHPTNTIEEFIPADPPAVTEDLSSWSWTALDPLNALSDIYGAVVIQQC